MAVTYTIEGGLVTMTLEGKYLPEDVVSRFLSAMRDERCPDPLTLLVDVSASTSLATRPTEQIRVVAERLGEFKGRIARCAVLATTDVNFGLSRLGAVYSEGVGVHVQVFRDLAQALAWLQSTDDAASS